MADVWNNMHSNLSDKGDAVIPTDRETSEKTQQSESEKSVEAQDNVTEKQEGNDKEQDGLFRCYLA